VLGILEGPSGPEHDGGALYSGRQHGATYAPQFGVIASR
jgi:hypothetical protein